MTPATPPVRGRLPGLGALEHACGIFGVDARHAQLLHQRSHAVYLLPDEQIIARLAPATALRRQRARTVIAVSRWLGTLATPLALAPVPGDQPVLTPGAVATFWPYRPTTATPTPGDLARLLRKLHALPTPSFPLPSYRPLHRLHEALTLDEDRPHPAVSAEDRAWLRARARTLIDAFTTTQFPLGTGLIHADAHPDNLVHDGIGWVLIDWDSACLGPRELDLLSGLPDHFHTPAADRAAFLAAYDYDLTGWPGWPLLRDLAELHSLSAYIRLASSKPQAARELHHRIRSLRTGDTTAHWHPIS